MKLLSKLGSSKTLNFFVKSNEQCKTCFSIAMTRKNHTKYETSLIFTPSVRALPRASLCRFSADSITKNPVSYATVYDANGTVIGRSDMGGYISLQKGFEYHISHISYEPILRCV